MRIFANISFTETTVTCIPIAPALASYREQLALDDGALEFRLRLFAARIRGDAPSVSVAISVPRACVMQAQTGPHPFGDIPEGDLHIFMPDGDAAARPVAVERCVCDAVASFARAYGMEPVAIIVPQDGPFPDITMPIGTAVPDHPDREQDAPPSKLAKSAVVMPPALQRELHKRQQQKARKAARAQESWARDALLSLSPFSPIPALLSDPQDDSAQDATNTAVCVVPITPPTPQENAPAQIAPNDRHSWLRQRRAAMMLGTAASIAALLGGMVFWPATQQAATVAISPEAAQMPEASSSTLPDIVMSSTSLAGETARGTDRPTPPVTLDRAPQPMTAPQLPSLDALGFAPERMAEIAQDGGPPRDAATFPMEPALSQIMPPRIPGRILNNRRSLAALERTSVLSASQTQPPVVLIRPAQTLARVVPQPRPARPATAQAETPLRVTGEPDVPVTISPTTALGPQSTRRPIARPVAFLSERRSAPTPAAPQATASADPQGPVPGLRLVAIVETEGERQAIVQIGPNRRARVVAGSAAQNWQVVEIRADGLVLRVDGQAQLVPIGL